MMFGYKTAKVGEYLIINCGGMDDIRICKKAFAKPWQRVSRISMAPYEVRYRGLPSTVEKHEFNLDIAFIVAPDDNADGLKRYALTFSRYGRNPVVNVSRCEKVVKDLVNIIKAEVNATVSQLTIEEIFKERDIFKDAVMGNVQKQLQTFGIRVIGASIMDISDTMCHPYFSYASRNFEEAVSNQAQIDRAETEMKGEVGKARVAALKSQEVSKIEAETITLETDCKKAKADAETELSRHKQELNNRLEVAKMTAKRHYEMTDAELQRQVEVKKAERELERLRASEVVQSKASRESAQEKADARLYEENKEADAALYKVRLEADALYYYQKREAEGMLEMAKAYGALVNVLGGPQGFLQYKMIESGTYEKLAKATGLAINGLQPKITMWNTGNGDSSSDNPIRNILQSLPPLFSTIHDQTGIAPPSWLARMPRNNGLEEDESQEIIPKTALLN
ncbi:hypothetical protein NFIA_083860 [Paecilomyces variotii No. 5]|uniref:Band 7 domain-containing protein n=1 Tax=Byssochlamys spectabilis (strain No. 5 / NBRC 109023) TaxID=1356009 RepID=V5G865_BYSSN|nr:hypothetical protein NFIA_083860 [Paecilomyces variotii No. 5]